MHESELWITRIFNDYLAGAGNAALSLARIAPQERPWHDFVVMQILVVLILMVVFALLRMRLSFDRPGPLQHTFELVYDFVRGQAEDQIGHAARKYVAFFGTIFLFILTCNLIGLIPAFESPTMNAPVTAGCAVATFIYYNSQGVWTHGIKYLAHFVGPMWWLGPLMVPIEVVSHL